MPEPLLVVVEWTTLTPDDSRWDAGLCLYAYVYPSKRSILYIGKADLQTVKRRLYGRHKDEVFNCIWELYGLEPNEVEVIQGDLTLGEGKRRSSPLLSDVESLLIIRLQPPCNVASKGSRIYRPGLRVECQGDWPRARRRFRDWT